MLYDPTTASQLKAWLVRTLEPICDAEPGALADYIQALLKHNVPEPEMRKELETQLDEFLEKECSAFLNSLFNVLRTKSYLPYNASASSFPDPADSGIPIPLDGLIPSVPGRGLKRSSENDDRDGRPTKGPRLSFDSQVSRNLGAQDDRRPSGNWAGRGGRQMNGGREDMTGGGGTDDGMNYGNGAGRRMQYHPPDQRRGICRDYYNSGYCSRGAFCKFSHGDDAVVPNQLFPIPASIMPFMMLNEGMPFGGAYDPNESRIDMRGRRAPIMSRALQAEGGNQQHGELPVIQDLTPASMDESTDSNILPEEASSGAEQLNESTIQSIPTFESSRIHVGPRMDATSQMDVDLQPRQGHMGGGGRGFQRGGQNRGRGASGGVFRPAPRVDKTLVVEKIPQEKLNLEEVNNWFKRFGTVTNVAIDVTTAKALVSFTDHSEARAAWKSEDAVFGNRFVKVFWHRPMEGHGQTGARMLAASAPLVANMSVPKETPALPPPKTPTAAPPATHSPRKAPAQSAASTALAEKQRVLEQQITEQKSLMSSLSTASGEEKKQIMARLRKLGEEMKPSETNEAPLIQQQDKKKMRLDKELDLHHASVTGGEGQETAEELKAKLEKLKAEAASLGISDPEQYPSGSSYRGGYRGRGRGRGTRPYYGGGGQRGGMPRSSMKLDNRPRKLVVKGASADSLQAVRDWYETTGQLESANVQDDGDIVVAFRSRAAAEQGMAKGSNISTVGTVQIIWHSDRQPSSKPNVSGDGPPETHLSNGHSAMEDVVSNEIPSHSLDEDEEIISGGWGGDGDVGM